MKIHNHPDLAALQAKETDAGNRSAKKSGISFADLLNQAAGVEQSAPVAGVNALQAAGGSTFSQAQNDALAYGEDTLGLLDRLGTLLGSPDTTDSTMDTVASMLNERAEGLKAVRDGLDPQDPLRQAMNNIGILSAVESAKISRGDYEA